MKLEQDFTEIKRASRSYLKQAQDAISRAEGKNLCAMAAEFSEIKLSADVCLKIQNSLFAKGQSLAH